MLTNAAVAARATPGARLLYTTTNTSRLSLLQSRQLGQSRRFRFGRCSGASETESQASRDLRSRQGRFKYRSSSATNRKLSWDHNSGSEGHKTAMKNVMAGRYVDADKVQSWSDELSGLRPGRNIEDVERNAINHLFHGDSTPAQYEYDPLQSPFDNMRNYMASKRLSAEAKKAKSKSPSAQDFVAIDPITNRKMPSQDATITSSMQRADPVSSYAHFTVPQTLLRDNAEMTHSNGPPPPEELKKYDPVKWMEPCGQPAMSAEELSKSYSDLAQYGPISWREPSGAPPATAEEKSKQYNDLAKYKPVEFSEPTGQLPPSAEELSKQYEDLDMYEAIKFNEPHGRLPPTAEEQSKKYADLDKYESVQFNEPHGQLPPSLEELSKKYADLNKYESVQFNEPHGQLPPSAEELSKQYDDLHKYEAVKFNEPDGQLPATPEELSKKYKDVHHYGPISFNEPAGRLPPTAEELSKQYDDLHKYGPVTFNEPNGQLPPTPEVLSKQYPDLHKYGPVMWNEPDGQLPPSSEVLSKKYQDLHYYAPVQFNEPDGQLPKTAEEKSKVYKDVHHYGPVAWNEPHGKLPLSAEEKSKKYKDLDGYEKPITWNEPNGQPAEHPEEASKRYEDLEQYQPVRWNEPDGKPPMTPEESSKQYKDLDGYSGPYTHNEPDGKPTQRGASSMDDAMSSYGRNWDVTTKAAQTTLKQAKIKATASTVQKQPKTTLTGNYVRDFPEDFAVSWSRMLGEQPSPEKVAEEAEEADIASFDESFPSLSRAPQGAFSTRLEPALNRTLARAQADPYSLEPQGLELSYADEIGARTAPPSFVRMYGTVSDAAAASKSNGSTAGKSSSDEPAGKNSPGGSAPGPQASPKPSHYKILAYDPTMQTISTAETSSLVEDTAAPLSPPEVMMRLSNPIKFFPHLGPLQAQGYEIVSGSGDVLVFRRVRDAQPGAENIAIPGTTERPAVYQAPRVNPIDMMGSQPVTPHSYSASPTGYVNYEDEAEASNKPLPPFRTRSRNPRANQSQVDPSIQPETKKSNKGKKLLIGAASVGGLSYAAGVVGEFFQTGGTDGKGPNTRF